MACLASKDGHKILQNKFLIFKKWISNIIKWISNIKKLYEFYTLVRPKQNIVLFPASLAKKNRVGRSEKDFIFYFIFILFLVDTLPNNDLLL